MHLVHVTSHFSSAHRLAHPDLTDRENAAIYGVCSNPSFHGHNYKLEVTVAGDPDPATALVANYLDIKQIVQKEIIDKVDHKNLNIEVPFLAGKVTTTETLLSEFWRILAPLLRSDRARLYSLTITEGSDYSTSYYGEDAAAR